MPKANIITGLDIGTQNIKILVAKREPKGLAVFDYQEVPSSGVRRGVVIHLEEVSRILRENFLKIKEEGQKIDFLYLNIGGAHLFSIPSQGAIAVSRADQKISEEDINRVLDAAQTINLPSNKEIFDVVPREFIIDGEKGIKEPLGLKGVRLEAEVLVLAGFSPYLNNLTKTILDSGLQILDMIPSPIASGRACLTEKQKELGVAILDIGAGTCDLTVFEEGDLIHLAVLPMGSSNITNDIAIGLKTDIEIAERIKIEFGNCLWKGGQKVTERSLLEPKARQEKKLVSTTISHSRSARVSEKIKLDGEETLIFSQRQLTNIIAARVSEMFREINKELKKISREKLLPAGIVLTGGGAKLPGIIELAKKEFRLPARLGKPKGIEDLDENDPSLSTVCGLVLLGRDLEEDTGKSSFPVAGIGSKLKRIFKIFIP
ncbi:MAG: cell division protein FtsA [Candidatus Nealsonbacteria bacterium CG_4_10_14_0_2_um_filter_37_10]|uniref:Cell division protein FtsA n=1 Tax=Candidatus Nealsonbacteria bacterium CG_4_10_14_0_2_um_filter_37_10 TaxID=1974679 RepID=A0A2M7V062_9BACT|nr:MAG: cell division protein FtsA [Candidatus Nealsonbacteria bacterium CG_4_10_14_0_2_um_filter_37_10]